MAPFAFISMFELLAILIILIFQLNVASAFAGIGMTVLFIPIQVYLAKQFARRRTNTAHQTDLRVRYTSELIDGIATVKSYAWENPFFSLLCGLRRKEMACIRQSQTLRAVNQGLFYCIPWVAAFATFSVFWASGTGCRLTCQKGRSLHNSPLLLLLRCSLPVLSPQTTYRCNRSYLLRWHPDSSYSVFHTCADSTIAHIDRETVDQKHRNRQVIIRGFSFLSLHRLISSSFVFIFSQDRRQ